MRWLRWLRWLTTVDREGGRVHFARPPVEWSAAVQRRPEAATAMAVKFQASLRTTSGPAEPGRFLGEKPPSVGAVWSAKRFRRSAGGLSFDQPFHVGG